jgi:hypothetical protein
MPGARGPPSQAGPQPISGRLRKAQRTKPSQRHWGRAETQSLWRYDRPAPEWPCTRRLHGLEPVTRMTLLGGNPGQGAAPSPQGRAEICGWAEGDAPGGLPLPTGASGPEIRDAQAALRPSGRRPAC